MKRNPVVVSCTQNPVSDIHLDHFNHTVQFNNIIFTSNKAVRLLKYLPAEVTFIQSPVPRLEQTAVAMLDENAVFLFSF